MANGVMSKGDKMKVRITVVDDDNQTYEGMAELSKITKQKSKKQIISGPKGSTNVVKDLYFQNYFENSRTLHDVEQKMKSKKYNFDPSVITMSLQRARFLKQEGKRGNYSYIQKTPPN